MIISFSLSSSWGIKKYKASGELGKLEYIREQNTTNITLLEAISFSLSWPAYSYAVDILFQSMSEVRNQSFSRTDGRNDQIKTYPEE